MVHAWLESQIIPCHAVIFLDSVYAVKSARKWVDMELEMARRHGKRIIGVQDHGKAEISAEGRERVDVVVPWDAAALVEAIAGAGVPAP
jgi:hypothetical protein